VYLTKKKDEKEITSNPDEPRKETLSEQRNSIEEN
jgi:hypothetical protein